MRRPPLALLLGLWLALFAGMPAAAVVHTTGTGAGNTTPPADDPGFANVGVGTNNLSGVYLGNRWVLTADHVGEVGFKFAGVTYPVLPGSRVRLQKPPGTQADLALVRILGFPPLPPLALSSESPKEGTPVTMIGNGWNRESNLTCWNASFVEIACPPPGPPAAYTGYQRYGSNRAVRWGVNEITATGLDVTIGNRTTRAFEVAFDTPGIADEAQSVVGDSGGAAFQMRGSTWELVGIQFAMAVFEGQPNNTAVFGDESLMVDVFHYRDEIDGVLAESTPQVPVAPWPALALGAGLLLAVARRALRVRGQ
jgi:hypothetical protein